MRFQKGFTLMELMIAVGLVAILAAIAIPSYRGYSERANRAELQATLSAAAGSMERYKSQRFSYTGATAGTAATDTIPSRSPVNAPAGEQKYNIALTFPGGGSTFLITATSTSRFSSAGTEVLTINHTGARCYRPLESGSPSTCNLDTSITPVHQNW